MPISGPEYQFVQNWVHERSGIVLTERERCVVEARLVPLVRLHKAESIGELITRLQAGDANGLSELTLDALLPKETMFFRDTHPFEVLRRDIFKKLEFKRAKEKKLKIWCAGCSTGQEVYSVAITLHRYFSQMTRWHVEIIGTDLAPSAIQRATEGRYDEIEVRRGVLGMIINDYFQPDGPGWYKIRDEVKPLVHFQQLNLLGQPPYEPDTDIIFLRNVIRYMSPANKKQVLAQVKTALKPDGALFLGAQETTVQIDSSFAMVPVERSVYFQQSTQPTAS